MSGGLEDANRELEIENHLRSVDYHLDEALEGLYDLMFGPITVTAAVEVLNERLDRYGWKVVRKEE